jgi:hypothetical protein
VTPKEVQLGEIRQQIAKWREDIVECRRLAAEARKSADAHDADAAHSEAMVRRWEVVHNAVRLQLVPDLDGCLRPERDVAPNAEGAVLPHPTSEQCTCKTCGDRRWREAYGTSGNADDGNWARGEVPF